MKSNFKNEIPPLYEVIAAAMYDAFIRAAERAKQTRTYLVIERKGLIERIPYDKIDKFIEEQKKRPT